MNWSKAKTILIAAFLATDLILGSLLVAYTYKENSDIRKTTESSIAYLERRGIKLAAELPEKQVKLPALHMVFSEEGSIYSEYEGVAIESRGDLDKVLISPSETKLSVLPVYNALLSCEKDFSEAKSDIEEIKLVYYIDVESLAEDVSEDTALPYWKLCGKEGIYFYYPAFSE